MTDGSEHQHRVHTEPTWDWSSADWRTHSQSSGCCHGRHRTSFMWLTRPSPCHERSPFLTARHPAWRDVSSWRRLWCDRKLQNSWEDLTISSLLLFQFVFSAHPTAHTAANTDGKLITNWCHCFCSSSRRLLNASFHFKSKNRLPGLIWSKCDDVLLRTYKLTTISAKTCWHRSSTLVRPPL